MQDDGAQRPDGEVLAGHRRRLLHDPEGVADRYVELESLAVEWQSERERLRQRACNAERERKTAAGAKAEAEELRAQLSDVRAQNSQLRADLARVRGARANRIGRAILAPARIGRKALRNARDRAARASKAPESNSNAEAAAPTIRVLATSMPADDKVSEFELSPAASSFAAVLHDLWYSRGEITRPAGIIAEFPEFVEGADAKLIDLIEQIRASDHLFRNGYAIPPRSKGAAMRTAAGRIMYCAHSTPTFGSNGYAVRTEAVAAALKALDVDIVVAARAGYPWDSGYSGERERMETQHSGVRYVHHPAAPLREASVLEAIDEAADAFLREARRQRPSVIHAASNYLTALPALLTARKLGLPFVYEVRGFWELSEASSKPGWEASERFALQLAMEDTVLREADAVVTITTQMAERLAERGVPPKRIALLPNGIDSAGDLPLPADAAFAKELGIPRDAPWIGFAGSFVAYEGLDVLLEAAALLRERGERFQIVLAGAGPVEPALRVQAGRLGLDDVVHFVGKLPRSSMARFFSLVDIVACPRLDLPVTRLVSPLKPLEAFAYAKAVVLSDVAPHRDLAGAQSERALLCKAGSPEDLARALQAVIDDPELRTALGRRSRHWAARERDWRVLAKPIAERYQTLARAPRADAREGEGPRLRDLRIGLIADEFTTKVLAASATLEILDRSRWREQLEGLDFVLVESAWEGNGGGWWHGVGRYSDHEHSDIAALLQHCRELDIPTVFWNKEDPVHVKRFIDTAVLCDYVFTVDANLIREYRRRAGPQLRGVASMPFFAQPRIHNPIPQAPELGTLAYAGTFYGERYAKRSRTLLNLLRGVEGVGLTIYDRQTLVADSPYRFPPDLQEHVQAGVPYDEIADTYRAHIAHVNVNSVTDSPTMFSRRVVEIAASGGVVLSGPSRALGELFADVFPLVEHEYAASGYAHLWSLDPATRRAEAWRQMRAVMRAYTADDALTIIARTVGIAASAPPRPTYCFALPQRAEDQERCVDALLSQSVLPAIVIGAPGAAARDALAANGIEVVSDATQGQRQADWLAVSEPQSATWFEDLMMAAQFGEWSKIDVRIGEDTDTPRALAVIGEQAGAWTGLVANEAPGASHDGGDVVTMTLAAAPETQAPATSVEVRESARRLLIAGHDLKFIRTATPALEARGFSVAFDEWRGHTHHDEEASEALLAQADVVLAEWALGNAVWFAKHKRPRQRLVVRAHSQELQRPYMAAAGLVSAEDGGVDRFVFVSEVVRQAAVLGHGIPADKTAVVPNFVNCKLLDQEKLPGAHRRIGFVGYVPQQKRLDVALDVLERSLTLGADVSLAVKGRAPEDFPWMLGREDEMRYYEEQTERVKRILSVHPDAVTFEAHSDDMPEWYRSVGQVLSTSDYESFHYTIADGAASGAQPHVLAWPGADALYPGSWLHADVDSIARAVTAGWSDYEATEAKAFVKQHYRLDTVVDALAAELRGDRPAGG